MTSDVRQAHRETQLLVNESRWLQKAHFALSKARQARTKLAEHRGTEPESLALSIKEHPVSLDEIGDAFHVRIDQLMEAIEERRRILR